MKIYAPVKDANGVYASVRFVNGVGETDNPRLIEWFKLHGYKVPLEEPKPIIEDIKEETPIKIDNDVEFVEINKLSDEPDFDNMTPNDLRDWMREHGYGSKIKNTRNKEKLLEILRG